MIERVRDHRILGAEQGFEQTGVRVETGRVQDGIVHAQKLGQPLFQLVMHAVGAADEADRRHAETIFGQPFPGCRDQIGIVGQPEIVVGAEVDDFALRDLDGGTLRRMQFSFMLVKPLLVQRLQLLVEMVPKFIQHVETPNHFATRSILAARLRAELETPLCIAQPWRRSAVLTG
jgi:hypothetical protein